MSKDVVYSLKCAVCGEEYVGETERTARKRSEEHHGQAKNATQGKPWGEHYRKKHHIFPESSLPFAQASILAQRQRSYVDRRIMEALFMRKRKPAVNMGVCWAMFRCLGVICH